VLKDFFCEEKVFKEANDPLEWDFVECHQDVKNIDSKIQSKKSHKISTRNLKTIKSKKYI